MIDTTNPDSVRELAEHLCYQVSLPRENYWRIFYAALCDAILAEREGCRGIAADYCTSSSLECARLIFNRPSPRRDHQGERR